jgi:chromosome segregation protein
MFLNELDLCGFKSFPSKLKLKFGEGITAIVGPNGCGKTNIVDAVRWVLGEQKTTLLRSQHMEDVIFNGTAQRKPLGMAEVSLTIDNTAGVLPEEFSEVMITRRLFRSGESEYLLNKAPCRRKDIVDLFLDTGMAPHAYSVIELSMVESILGDQADALRVLFEEAAGIAKYKQRRKEALRKLARTKDNLLRLGDIITEVETGVRSLRRQAARAQRHQRFTDELKKHEVTMAVGKFRWRREEIDRLNEKLAETRTRADSSHEALESKSEQVQQLRQQSAERDSSLTGLREQLAHQDELIHGLNEQVLVGQERRQGLGGQLSRLRSDIEQLQERKQSLHTERAERAGEKTEVTGKLDIAQGELREKEEKINQLDGRSLELRSALDRHRGHIADLLQQRNDIRQELEVLGGGRETAQRRAQSLSEEIQRTGDQLEQAAQRLREIEKNVHLMQQDSQKIERQLEKARQVRDQLTAEITKVGENRRDLESQIEIHRERREVLAGVLEAYEGYQRGVKSVLTELPHLAGVIGTVADILQTQDQYVRATEAALGEAAQYIVVQKTDTALQAIEHLRQNKAGQATFLILDEVERLERPSRPVQIVSNNGEQKWAADVVSCIPQHRPLVEFLLGKVVIVERLETIPPAGEQNDGNQLVWVSLSGDVRKPPAFMRGGHAGDGSGLLDRREKIRQVELALEDLVAKLESTRAQQGELDRQQQDQADAIAKLEETLRLHQEQTAPAEKELETQRLQHSVFVERRTALTAELKGLDQTENAPDGALGQLTHRLTQVEAQLAEKRENLHRLEEDANALEISSRTALKEANEARVRLVTLQGRNDQIGAEEERWQQIEGELESTLTARRSEIDETQRKIAELTEQINEKTHQIEIQTTERTRLRDQETSLQQETVNLRDVLQNLETEIREYQEQREGIQKEVHDLELQLAELQIKQQSAQERTQEEYGVNLEDYSPAQDGEELSEADREERIGYLQERLRAMGPVNLAALEEYNAQKERYDFLASQRDDLLQAEEHLNGVIADLNRRARRLFSETFKQVKGNFQIIFKKMFDGGEADLSLDAKGDPLEADIQIFACPGGKKLRHIAQLSGGEKALTAISLLFSLYQVKPSPFCVLDEVDAPLDDANIGRFVAMLKGLSEKSQFIIITHNKNTMAAADVLYGVTMEQSGVSKVVSVNLRQEERAVA